MKNSTGEKISTIEITISKVADLLIKYSDFQNISTMFKKVSTRWKFPPLKKAVSMIIKYETYVFIPDPGISEFCEKSFKYPGSAQTI